MIPPASQRAEERIVPLAEPAWSPPTRSGLVAVGLGAVLLVGSWYGLGVRERSEQAERFEHEVEHAARHLGEHVAVRIVNAEAISSLRAAGMLGEEARFRRHARIVQERLGGYFAINWIDPDGVIRWVSPLEPNRRAVGHSVFEHPQAAPMARLAARRLRPTLTGPLHLFQGRDGFAAYLPVVREERLAGFVNAVFDLQAVLRRAFGEDFERRVALRIEGHDGNHFETPGFEHAWRRGPKAEARVRMLDFDWTLRAAPTEAALASWPRSPVRHGVLAVGMAALLFAALLLEKQRERVRLRQELDRARRELAQAVADSPDVVALASPDGTLRRLNPAGAERLGAEMQGRNVLACVHGEEERLLLEATLRRAVERGEVQRATVRFGRQGRMHEVAFGPIRGVDGAVESVLVHGRDVQDQIDMEQRLARSQRLEAVGRLAGGVAHDFNNVLAAITALASLVRQEHPEVAGDMEALVEAADRGGELTRKLLAFARHEVGETLRRGEVGAVLASLRKLLRSVVPEDVSLLVEDPDEPLWVGMSATELEQVLTNLVLNAVDAVDPGGRIEVRVRPSEAHVEIAVVDDGCGMAPEVREHAFEPFFTTKAGRGSGLGLASVYGLVRAAGGTVSIESAEGEGTTVRVRLPRTAAPAHDEQPQEPTTDLRGRTVLLVEDEATVRRALARWLRARGMEVVAAADGREALRAAVGRGLRPDVVVTDVVMPHMNGPQLIEALRSMGCRAPVVFVSGYVESALERERAAALGGRLVAKPFHPEALLRLLGELLGERPSEPSEDEGGDERSGSRGEAPGGGGSRQPSDGQATSAIEAASSPSRHSATSPAPEPSSSTRAKKA